MEGNHIATNNNHGESSSAISLPTGGGAISGIGETFQPNLFSGTGNFSIPIATSTGRQGFGPLLSLQYSTGSGNSPFGLGWQLSIPRITRKTEKGLPTYTDKDTFVISGAEDLVLAQLQIPNSQQPPGYTVIRYRPRTEGLFARIEKWEKTQDDNMGEVHWRVTTKENITSIYGRTTQARLFDLQNPIDTYEWLLEETFDAKGNHIRYEYIRENKILNIQGINEQNRSFNQLYLRRIYYGNTPDDLADVQAIGPQRSGINHKEPLNTKNRHYLFEVLFDYFDLPETAEESYQAPIENQQKQELTSQSWPVESIRPDPFSSFRPGFEVRTLRRCKRVLMFHHFKELHPGTSPNQIIGTLVRSTDFQYQVDSKTQLSSIQSVTGKGFNKQNGIYTSASLPPVTFKYSQFEPHKQRYQSIEAVDNDLPPRALNDARFTLMDIHGDGLPDILNTSQTGFRYWRNLGNGRIDRPHQQHQQPAGLQIGQPGVVLADMAGDGLPDMLVEDPPLSGFYEATPAGGWKPFKRFENFPSINLADPNVRLFDLTGDGLSDILMTRDHHFLWLQCLGESGYAEPRFIERQHDLNKFPDVYFNDPSGRVRLADMTGDGLNDIVLVHDGRIDYWPNLGYGHFGNRLTMKNAPRQRYGFDPKRLFMVDIDGTGCADLVYVDFDSIHFWFNQSGNAWSEEQRIQGTPVINDLSAIQFTDFNGTGTATILWSYDYHSQPGGNYKILDFCGGQKPHLLTAMNNKMGATTRVRYAPSTKFFLEDRAKGEPWATHLPFPVQVLEKTEVIDHLSKTKLVTQYSYHHGYFDGREREFRGFGRVDQLDTEVFEDFSQADLHDENIQFNNGIERSYFSPPALTKTWFHTGVYFDESNPSPSGEYYDHNDLIDAFQKEWYQGDAHAFMIDANAMPASDTPHEAYRALRGSVIRSEVYGLDGSSKYDHPYTVSQSRYQVKQLQAKESNHHAVYLTTPLESYNYHYERNPDDPRVTQQLMAHVDEYGNVSDSISIAYPRRNPLYDEQRKPQITYQHSHFINKANETNFYYIGIPDEQQTFQIVGLSWSWVNSGNLSVPFGINDFSTVIEQLSNQRISSDYQAFEDRSELQLNRRLLSWVRNYFRPDQNANTLTPNRMALGEIEAQALPFESYQTIFSDELAKSVYGSRLTQGDFKAGGLLEKQGGYVRETDQPDLWWVPSGKQAFQENTFFQAIKTTDPFGNQSELSFDQYGLLLASAVDSLNNKILAENNYRVLQPEKVTDPNGNHSFVAFDALGLVVGTAIQSKEGIGDTLVGFEPDLELHKLRQCLDDPLHLSSARDTSLPNSDHDPHDVLRQASSRTIYDLNAVMDGRGPVVAYTMSRENHYKVMLNSNLQEQPQTRIQHAFLYSDGFGRELQTKIQAEPGPIYAADGGVINNHTEQRWVGTGTKRYNNKGNPVREFEPFFSETHTQRIEQYGVSPMLFYDPLERVVATLHPNHTYEKIVFDPWHQEIWDVNDTIDPHTRYNPLFPAITAEANYNAATDPDVGHYFALLTPADYLPTWYASRIVLPVGDAEHSAAVKAAQHAATPSVSHLDVLGRPFLNIVDNGIDANGDDQLFSGKIKLDISGNDLNITDPRNIIAFRHDVDMAGRKLRVNSVDAGARLNLPTIDNQPMVGWDARGIKVEILFDQLRRPTHTWVTPETGIPFLAETIIYGERLAPNSLPINTADPAAANNHRGQVYKIYDNAGLLINSDYDFKGNALESTRKLLKLSTIETTVHWAINHVAFDEAAANNLLDDQEEYTQKIAYDALNRVTQSISPDGSISIPTYTEANLLESVDATIRGAGTTTTIVENIYYNAKGQREKIEYGNNATTTYQYDVDTYRITNLTTEHRQQAIIFQELSYTYDPVGNITQLRDDAQQTIYFNNRQVNPLKQYRYDPGYRLIEAKGREHEGAAADQPHSHQEFLIQPQPDSNLQALRTYTQTYDYDASGNFKKVSHDAGVGHQWSRDYETYTDSNRLQFTTQSNGDVHHYPTDENGNIVTMAHLDSMLWDFKNRLILVDLGGGGIAYYQYDSGMQRVRKVVKSNGTIEERVYLGDFEIYREYNNGNLDLRRETLHVMDGQQRVAMVETLTHKNKVAVSNPQSIIRFQLNDHLGSSTIELDENAEVISYEEYYPYGGAAYHAAKSSTGFSQKRYRYSGKERDDETGLYYYGARYYAPWIGRWISCDPKENESNTNKFQFCSDNCIVLKDPNGLEEKNSQDIEEHDNKEKSSSDIYNREKAANRDPDTFIGRLRAYWGISRGEEKMRSGDAKEIQEGHDERAKGISKGAAPVMGATAEGLSLIELGTGPKPRAKPKLKTRPTNIPIDKVGHKPSRFERFKKWIGEINPFKSKKPPDEFIPSWKVTSQSQGAWRNIKLNQLTNVEKALLDAVVNAKSVIAGRSINVKGRGMLVLDTWLEKRGIKWSQRWQDVYNRALYERTASGKPVKIMAGGGYTRGEVIAAEKGARASGILNEPYWPN